MSDTLSFDVTLAHKIKRALIRNGIPDAADLDWLAAGDNIARVRMLRLGYANIVNNEHVIDLSSAPLVPNGMIVGEHRSGNYFKWNSKDLTLYLSPQQTMDKSVIGHRLLSELARLPAVNANVLDFLLVNQNLIPKEWEGKEIHFWGTMYMNKDSVLHVRFMYLSGKEWCWNFRPLYEDWGGKKYILMGIS